MTASLPTSPLKNIWYFACPSKALTPGKMERRFFCGMAIVIGRDHNGKAFAMRDVCPHRAAPLSAGRQVNEGGQTTLECPYHGWRIRTEDGICAKIPALSENSEFPVHNMRVLSLPVHEDHGTVWLYFPADPKNFDGHPQVVPPSLDNASSAVPKMIITVPTEGPYDEAVIGLVDPAHTPFVHQQWFWRTPKKAEEKVKNYQPSENGFLLPAHKPSANGRAYRLIGGEMTTEIKFQLPGIRLETIRNEKYTVLGLTTITPTQDGKSEITQMFFWDMPLMTILKPALYPLAKKFLGQDGAILRLQNTNIQEQAPHMMYVDDPDMLAKWYRSLTREWRQSVEQGREFVNPLKPATLRWRT
ncbi:MAG: Rieske 2Fe-2S domain-containing protein [bacterium]